MGKPAPARLPAYRDDPSLEDAVSLHTTAADDDFPDLAADTLAQPPAYTDEVANESVTAITPNPYVQEHTYTTLKTANDVELIVDQSLETDAGSLEAVIRRWAIIPPAKLVIIRGTHKQTTKNGDKKETQTVTDFELKLRLTEYLFTHPGKSAWHTLRTVENAEKTHRGTVLKKRVTSGEGIALEEGKPTLQEWCHRFCADHSKLKTFLFTREVTGLDQKLISERLISLIRSTNYRGHLTITFPTENLGTELYSDNFINRWRNNTWICLLFYISMLWLFTWPYLFFATKRYAVVKADWPFSVAGDNGHTQYATISETQWLARWSKVIEKAALEKRQSVLTEEDLARVNEPVQQVNTGNSTLDSAVSLVGAGFRVFNEANRQLGWGGDC